MGKEVASDMRFLNHLKALSFLSRRKRRKKPSLPNIFRAFQQYFFSFFGECGARQKIACKQAMLQIFLLLRLTFNSVSHTRGVPTCSSRILGTQRRESDSAKSENRTEQIDIYAKWWTSAGNQPTPSSPLNRKIKTRSFFFFSRDQFTGNVQSLAWADFRWGGKVLTCLPQGPVGHQSLSFFFSASAKKV